jgi:hypothetical protein
MKSKFENLKLAERDLCDFFIPPSRIRTSHVVVQQTLFELQKFLNYLVKSLTKLGTQYFNFSSEYLQKALPILYKTIYIYMEVHKSE